jgi:hypothetical protein
VDFHLEHPYDAAPDVVFAMMTTPEFIRAKLVATEALEYDVVECSETPDGGFRVVTTRTVQADIPSFARKIFKPTNAMTQTEEWTTAATGTREASWRIEPKGVPVSTAGTSRLESADGATVQHIIGSIKVSVPLIGGRLERFVYDQASKTMQIEHEFGQRWLAERA